MVWAWLAVAFFLLGSLPALFAYLIYFADQPGLSNDDRRRLGSPCVLAASFLWGASIWTFLVGVLL
jgi:hypothetical protein